MIINMLNEAISYLNMIECQGSIIAKKWNMKLSQRFKKGKDYLYVIKK